MGCASSRAWGISYGDVGAAAVPYRISPVYTNGSTAFVSGFSWLTCGTRLRFWIVWEFNPGRAAHAKGQNFLISFSQANDFEADLG